MAAYYVLTHTIDDVERYYGEYVPQVVPLFAKHGIEVVAVQLDGEPLEGDASGTVVLRAASMEVLQAFYDDPDYEGPKALRHSLTSGRNLVLAPEFGPAETTPIER